MLSLRRLFGLMLLFLFFEAVVAVVTTLAWPNVSVFLACLAMTGLAVGVWVVFALVTRIMTRPRVAPPAPQARVTTLPVPRPSSGDDAFALEMNALVREANRRLVGAAQLNAKREQPTVATLPLFLVMGAEGGGKTSALVNSGLEPHLLAGEASREGIVLPTRVCNLWLAEGSVFADISGRVVMQEPEHWEKALRILSAQQRVPRWKKTLFGRQGPQPNLTGVVVVADTNLFVRAPDPQRISAFARTLNDRLQTVGTVFGKDFPVYVLFSKCDALQSFPEFFAHLSDAEGRKLVGVTLPLLRPKNESADIYADREGKRLTDYFNRLYMSLADKRGVFLAREDDSRKKSLGYEFPRELKKLRGELVQFLLDAFRSNLLNQGSRLRGFYFAGQRYVSRAAAATGLENSVADFSVVKRRTEATILFGSKLQPVAPSRAAAPEGTIAKWTFLTEVFHEVILKDRAGNTTPRVDTREQSYRHLALGAVGAVFLILSLLWVNSWRNNRQLLDEVASAVAATSLAPPTAATPIAITGLESLREPLVRLLGYQRHGAPLSYRWGLYSGSDATVALDRLYFDRFRRIFISPVLELLTARFLSLQPNAPVQDDVYNLLKSYRMVASQTCPPDDNFLSTTLIPVWTSAVSAQPDSTSLAEKQMDFYIAELKIQNPYKAELRENSEAVGRAQAYLQNLNGPDKLFHALMAEVNRRQQPDLLTRYASNYTEVMTGPNSIDGVYTRDGWQAMIDNIHSHKLASAGEPCVVGSTSAISKWSSDASTDRDLQDLYVKSYVQHWKSFFEAHHVVGFSNTADASRKLRILADNNRSPLLGLIYMASHDTNVVAPATTVSKAEESIEQGAASVKQTVTDLFDKYGNRKPSKPADQLTPQPSLGSAEIMREFEPVHAMVDPANSEKWLNDKNQEYVKALENLSNALAAIPPKIDKAAAADKQLLDQANQAVVSAETALHSLKGSFPNEPSKMDLDLGNLLEEPLRYASAAIGKTPVKPIPPPPAPPDFRPVIARINRAENDLCSSIAPLQTKFPFDATSSLDATTQDLNQVFAPTTGTLAQFEQSPDVSQAYARQGKTWAGKADFPATYSQPFLQELNSLSQLRDALYADGGNVPHFDYTLTLDGTGKISFELDVDGHAIKYTPGKGSVQKLVWPPVTAAPTQLDLRTGFRFKSGQKMLAQFPGPWGLFRLLQAADDQNGGLFTFRSVMFANSHTPLQDSKGSPATIQIRIDSAASNIFGRSYFSKLRCEGWWAVQLAHAQP
jgi:type VI secretion system protein ImpL